MRPPHQLFAIAAITKLATLCAIVVVGSAERAEAQEPQPLTVFLVRHAEKLADGADPALSDRGKLRSKQLAHMLRDTKIAHVHSSNYTRTRSTAAPIAKQLGLQVETYNARDLRGLAARLKRSGGRQLVVGHSNTTPALVKLLGGDPGSPINDKGEYDRLYVVSVGADGKVTSILLRYGSPYQPADQSR